MNKPALMTAIALTLFMGFATAQELTPSMSPGTGSGESSPDKSSPFGFKGMGGDRPKDSKTEITATKQATFDNAASVAEFEGKVVVRDPQFTLFCDRLKVSLAENRKGIKTAEALGNVTIVQENTDAEGQKIKSIGRAGKAVFEPSSGRVTLTVWPQVQHGINNQVGTEEGTVMVLNRDGKSTTTGGSKTMIVDTGTETTQP
jgi:lipopolysaccharide transport protein LptA